MIKTAIFGSGFGNYGHLQALKTLPEFAVKAVCGSRFKPDPGIKIYESSQWKTVLNETELDLVVVAVPPEQQTALLLEAMKRKLAVMVEKPLCLSSSEFADIQKQFSLTHNYSAASFIFPELETWKKAQTLVHEGSLGALRSVSFDWKIESHAIKSRQKNWKSTTANGGSALFHFLPHLMHAVNFFAGPIESLSCVSLPTSDLGEDFGRPLCAIQMILKNKALVTINCSLAAPFGSGQTIEFNGSTGSAVITNPGQDYVRGYKLEMKSEKNSFVMDESSENPNLRSDLDSRTAPLISIYKKFLANWKTKSAIQPSLHEALETQRLIFLCETSAQEKRWVQV